MTGTITEEQFIELTSVMAMTHLANKIVNQIAANKPEPGDVKPVRLNAIEWAIVMTAITQFVEERHGIHASMFLMANSGIVETKQ